eukprot:4642632-Pyramimonas_sp.AAC.1
MSPGPCPLSLSFPISPSSGFPSPARTTRVYRTALGSADLLASARHTRSCSSYRPIHDHTSPNPRSRAACQSLRR